MSINVSIFRLYKVRNCFKKLGIRIFPFLFRVYLLLTEFNIYQDQNQNGLPVESDADFALYVCNNRPSAPCGPSRCSDVKDAILSLLQKGYCLSSPVPFFGYESPISFPRHASMDATEHIFRDYDPSFHANTPLLHPSSFYETRTYSGTDFLNPHWSPEFSPFRNSAVLPTVSTSSSASRPFDLTDPRGGEVWNQSLRMWDSHDRPLRPHVRSEGLLPDFPSERHRSNSMSVMHSSSSLFFQNTYSPTPLPFSFLTPAQDARSFPETEVLEDFSLGEQAPFNASFTSEDMQPAVNHSFSDGFYAAQARSEEPIHSSSVLNPNSAEFIPGSKKLAKQRTRSSSEHGKTGVKQRDLLEKAMLQQRIIDNQIVTLKLRGLPYSVLLREWR